MNNNESQLHAKMSLTTRRHHLKALYYEQPFTWVCNSRKKLMKEEALPYETVIRAIVDPIFTKGVKYAIQRIVLRNF